MTINPTTDTTVDRFETIAVDLIDPDPDNRPAVLDDAFRASVAQHGVLMPILVTPGDDGRYRLVAGERRYRAAVAAGHTTIPASVRVADDATAAVWQTLENLQRLDLVPSQEARQVARIMAAGMKQKALALALNRPLTWVRARLALVGLPAAVQDAIDRGDYEPSAALTFGKYAYRPEVLDVVLADNYGSGTDLDWRLERAAQRVDADREYNEIVDRYRDAGCQVHEGHHPRDAHQGAKRLVDLGVDDDTHTTETCHIVVIARGYDHTPVVSQWCADPKRHRPKGDSPIKAAPRPVSAATGRDPDDTERTRVARAEVARRNAFACEAIGAKLRARDVTDFVLPVLFATAGQTELKDAARLLGIEPGEHPYGGKDHVTPLRQWAGESTANLTRAMIAVAYTLAASHWNDTAKQALADWLDRLGYQPGP